MWHMSKRIKRFSANQTFFIDATSALIISTDTDVREITRYRKQRKGTLWTAKWRFEDNAAKDKTYPHRSDARRSTSTEMRNNKETSQRSETRSMSTMCQPEQCSRLMQKVKVRKPIPYHSLFITHFHTTLHPVL